MALYVCRACANEFESATKPKSCHGCGESKLVKVN